MEKIKTNRLLLAGDSWMDRRTWYKEIFDSEQVTNLAVMGSGNKYIADSVISHIAMGHEVDHVLVSWSGLNRIDIPLPLGVSTTFADKDSQRRSTWASKYSANNTAPWRDRQFKLKIEDPLVRLMYQEKGYVTVKNQALLNVVNLQNFLKAKGIPYLFCFLYDYTNADFDHNHLTGESDVGAFSTLGSVPKSHPMLAEIDRRFCMTPTGLDWALAQEQDHFADPVHLSEEGYHAWARAMMDQHGT
jgi:hypothetical protein